MSRRIGMALVALSAAVVVAAPVPKQLKNTDRTSILGDWEEPPEKARVWWFKEDGTAGGGDLPTPTRKGQYRLDPTANPKTLDWSTDNGKTWQLGLYSLENDTLKVNIAKDTKGVRPETLVETEQTYAITATRKKN
jgi:uncharacterized protein (TIGR03067 family)